MLKVFISPTYGEDKGSNGGIARVVEAQKALLANYGCEVVERSEEADILSMHAGAWVRPRDEKQLIVAHCHGLYWEEYEWDRWAVDLNREVIKVLKQSDACTAPSEWVANAIRRGMWLSPEVINHGVDLEKFTPLEEHETNLGYVFWNKSRVDPVCDVVPCEMLASLCNDVKFISTFGHRSSNLEVTGLLHPSKMDSLLRFAGVYLANTRETFGIGTLEALACGVPVLGWNWGGQAEIITHKKQGWLATPGNFDELREGLYYILANRPSMSIEARKLAEQYTWDKAIAKYAALYYKTWDDFKARPTVSVIIRSHNQQELLKKAVFSAVTQADDVDEVEVIIVDDCSTDGSWEVAQELAEKDSVLTAYQTPVNLGVAGAANYGVDRSHGRYILLLDDDNALSPGALEVLSSALDKDRDLDIAYGKLRTINDDRISAWPPAKADIDAQLAHKNQIPSSAMYRRRVFDRVNGYRRRCRTGEDPDFWCRALSFGFIGRRVTDAVTLEYLVREDSVSNTVKDWPWEAWYEKFNENYACSPAPMGKSSNVPSYEPVVVSVVIPVGPGHEEVVLDAIDSISAQSFIKWECIVVNDTGKELKVPSFCRVFSTPVAGSGVSIARNIGLEHAKGFCWVPLDADDYLDNKALEKFYNVWKKHKGYVYSDYMRVEEMAVRETPIHACDQVREMLVHPITGLYPVVSNIRFDEGFTVGEDWDFVVNMTAQGYCGTRLPEPLVYYRTSSGSNRKELLNDIELYRAKIQRKYKEANMCGCAKGGNAVLSAQQTWENQLNSIMASSNADDPELVLLQFLPENTAPMSFRGRATGKMYRFGSGSDSVKYVDRKDAEYLLTREQEFRIYDPELVSV